MPNYVYRGRKPYDPQAPASDVDRAPKRPTPPKPRPAPKPAPTGQRKKPPPLLTEHRRHIVALVANGKSNKEIASALHLEINTVKTQLTRIRERLGAVDRAHTVAVALKLRLITARDIEPTAICPPKTRGRQRKRTDGEVARPVDR